jgi:hypothetical protein
MSWTEEDVNRIHEFFGGGADVTSEDDTLQIKIDDEKINRIQLLNAFMTVLAEQEIRVISKFTVTVPEGADFDMVRAAAEKHHLQLLPIEGEVNRYRIVRKD